MKKITMGRAVAGMLSAGIFMLRFCFCFIGRGRCRRSTGHDSVLSCELDKNNVTVQVSSSANMEGTDGVLYLVELQPYQNSLEEERIMRLPPHRELRPHLHFP